MKKGFMFQIAILLLVMGSCQSKPGLFTEIAGETQGTTYHIKYEGLEVLQPQIDSLLLAFERSLSLWDSLSVISRINRNEPGVLPDEFFVRMFNRAMEISEITDGAFDITVGPLVNAYGFGFRNRDSITPGMIDSLRQFVGWKKVSMTEGKIVKQDPRIALDANAIAQGQAVDMIYDFLAQKEIMNFMVEIGGEVRTRGKNPKGEQWRIGVDKPIEHSDETNRSLEAIIQLSDKALSTSGNYRKFYEKDGVRYSHTIDPRTGKPVDHQLLSATVVAEDCMTADAWSTTLMVLGPEKARLVLESHPELEAFLIFADGQKTFSTWATPGLESSIRKAE